ncbi:MAG: metal ABC transporter substrate-binding protein [Planctomycetota bacterium]
MRLWLLALACCVWLVGCSESGERAATPTEPELERAVYATAYPVAYFAERISGGTVPVRLTVPEDADPVSWQPSAAEIAAFQGARLVVTNGAGFEGWVGSAPLARSRIVESTRAFEDELLTIETATHSHGPGGEHTHEGIDPHTWMDPVQAQRQARAIASAMGEAFEGEDFDANLAALIEDLASLDRGFRDAGLEGLSLLANHGTYNYLARRYGFEVRTVDLDPGSEDVVAAVEAVRGAIDESPALIMLWEAAPAEIVASALERELGVRSVVMSPGERRPGSGDYLALMRENILRLAEAGR